MNLIVVPDGDKRLDTVNLVEDFHFHRADVFISFTQMQTLLDKLAKSDFSWQEKPKIMSIQGLIRQAATPQVAVISSSGTSWAYVRSARMCDEFAQFDSVMATPRILWQFQTSRWDNGCVVPGYDNSAMPKD